MHRLTPIRDTLTADAAARHWARALPECGLTEAQVAAIDASGSREALFAALTRGHNAGHPMTDVLTHLATAPVDDAGGAGSAAELADRVTAWVDAHTPEPRDDQGTRHVVGLVDDGDPSKLPPANRAETSWLLWRSSRSMASRSLMLSLRYPRATVRRKLAPPAPNSRLSVI